MRSDDRGEYLAMIVVAVVAVLIVVAAIAGPLGALVWIVKLMVRP